MRFKLGIQLLCVVSLVFAASAQKRTRAKIGQEVAIPVHMHDGEEYHVPPRELIAYGEKLFTAMWTIQEGAGRPFSKGTGMMVADMRDPLIFPRNFNRISGPDTNSCSGCHNKPYVGGGGDIVANVFVLGQRFDFTTFGSSDPIPTKSSVDERGTPLTLQTMANSRKTIGMFGSGFIEMLARQMTADLQSIRNTLQPGQSQPLVSKGISFGILRRAMDGRWDTRQVEGISALSLKSKGPGDPPSLVIRPFHQAGNVISLREFTNNAFNHHHGMQSEERFGNGTDPDGDLFSNELTRADITATTVYQATLPVPGQVIPDYPEYEQAIKMGQQQFEKIGCSKCHVSALPLDNSGWIYTEPNPYNGNSPMPNLRVGEAPTFSIDLTSDELPPPRLKPKNNIVWVPAFTDLKLHDITSGTNDPNREPLDMNQKAGTENFFTGNGSFITRKLWGIANQHSFGHHGLYTTMREAVLSHSGEALETRIAFQALSPHEQDCVVEFLKSLQILPPGTKDLIISDDDRRRGHK